MKWACLSHQTPTHPVRVGLGGVDLVINVWECALEISRTRLSGCLLQAPIEGAVEPDSGPTGPSLHFYTPDLLGLSVMLGFPRPPAHGLTQDCTSGQAVGGLRTQTCHLYSSLSLNVPKLLGPFPLG